MIHVRNKIGTFGAILNNGVSHAVITDVSLLMRLG